MTGERDTSGRTRSRMRPASTPPSRPDPMEAIGTDEEEPLTVPLLEFFRRTVLPGVETVGPLDIRADRRAAADFDAEVASNGCRRFTMTINDGCVDWIHRALDVTEPDDLRIARDLAREIFADDREVGPILEGLMNLATLFVVFHEYAHVVCGHFHAEAAVSGVSRRTLREVGGSSELRRFHFAVDGVSQNEIDRVFELEADSAAFELLTNHAYEILRASQSTGQIFDAADEVRRAELEAIAERMAFLAAALVTALTEVSRSQTDAAASHPPALTRILSLCLTKVIAVLPYEWRTEEGTHVLHYGDDEERALIDQLVPMIADALDLCRSGCDAVGLGLRLRHDPSAGEMNFARAFAGDFTNIMAERTDLLVTEPGREFAELQAVRSRLLPALAPHRQVDWWSETQTDMAP